MGVIIRQGVKGTVANYLGIGIGVINTLFLFPKMLTEAEIGLIRLLLDVALVFATLAQLGITSIMTKFFPYFENGRQNKNGFFFFSLFYTFVGFGIFSLVYFFRKDVFLKLYTENSPLFQLYFEYVYPLTFIFLFIFFFETISYLFQRVTIPKIIREIYLRLFTAIIVVLYFFEIIDQGELIFAIVLTYFLALLFNIVNGWWVSKMSLSPYSNVFNKSFVKHLSSYTTFTIFGSLSAIIVAKIDTLMLGAKTFGR